MNRFLILLLSLLSCQLLLSQEINQVTKDTRGRERILGEITKKGFTENSFNSWFTPNYEAYEPNEKILKKLRRKLKKHTITVFMGTWCDDSKREVPRFYKILDAARFPKSNLRVIGLNNERSHYKQGPNGEEKGFNIHRVPTFIIYNKKGKEIGRIVEHPVESLEADLLKICKGNSYEHNYQIVTKLNDILQQKGTEYVFENLEKITQKLQPYSKSLKELNTYGYVLLRAKQGAKAIAAFKINTQLFPENKNTYDSLAEAYFETGDQEKAIKYYHKVLSIDANDTNAKTMLAKMQ